MKRCPQCDFIYEDDQSLCDMDGRELVFDSKGLLLPEDLVTQPTGLIAKSKRMNHAVLMVAGFLGTLLFLAYFVITPRTAPQSTSQSSIKVSTGPQSTPALSPAPPVSRATPTPSSAATMKANNSGAPIVKPARAPLTSPTPKLEEQKPREKMRPEPESSQSKKDSKVVSILKKTGRILKRPFKF